MRKLFLMSALFAAGLSLTSCSEKETAEEQGTEQTLTGERYIAVSINLPQTSGSLTRVDPTDQVSFEDGTDDEYAVKDAWLLIFSGSTEDGAKYKQSIKLDIEPLEKPISDPQVTEVSKKLVTKVDNEVSAGDLMLVLLNAESNGLVTHPEGTSSLTKVGKGGTLVDLGSSTTYQNVREALVVTTSLGASEMTGNGFFMANAPLADKQGTVSTADALKDLKVQTLVPIAKVYDTQANAMSGTADQIYVERGVAKVTVAGLGSITLTATSTEGSTTINYTPTIQGWTLDNTNTKSYLVRNPTMTEIYGSTTLKYEDLIATTSDWSSTKTGVYRFTGNTEITQGAPATYKYRTYFAQDPNYAKDAKSELTSGYNTDANYKATSTTGNANPQYCYENTFPVAYQKEENSTLVRLKVQAKTSGGTAADLFELNGIKSTIYTKTTIESYVKAIAKDLATSGSWASSPSDTDFEVSFGGSDLKNAEITVSVVSSRTSAYSGHVDTDGKLNETEQSSIRTAFKTKHGVLAYYKDGISYYTVRVKHFGDGISTAALTPWENGKQGVTAGKSYPGSDGTTDNEKIGAAKNWLGRYGVLRNNWYHINVSTIKFLGDPVPEAPQNVPDDQVDAYITFQINVLSWAKRTQNVEL